MPEVPHLAGQHADYILAQLTAFADGTRPNATMQAMASSVTEDERKQIASYFEGVDVSAKWENPGLDFDKLEMATNGKKLFDDNACAGCHMDEHRVSIDPTFPNIAGQKEAYVLNQLRAFKNGTRPSEVMPAMVQELSNDDLQALAAYLSQISPRK
jgi:cytochrome c553